MPRLAACTPSTNQDLHRFPSEHARFIDPPTVPQSHAVVTTWSMRSVGSVPGRVVRVRAEVHGVLGGARGPLFGRLLHLLLRKSSAVAMGHLALPHGAGIRILARNGIGLSIFVWACPSETTSGPPLGHFLALLGAGGVAQKRERGPPRITHLRLLPPNAC